MKINKLAVAATAVLLSACGVQKSMDAVQSTPGKMDRMAQRMDKTLEQMQSTNESIDMQKTLIAYEKMLDESYGRDLDPVPYDVVGFAKKFAQYATDENVVELVYAFMGKINRVPMKTLNPTPEEIARFDHKKKHALATVQSVAGLLSPARVERIIKTYIQTKARHYKSAMNLLMLRVMFAKNVMLANSLLSEPLIVMGELESAVEYADIIDYVARLPFAGQINLSVTGFKTESENFEVAMEPSVPLDTWQDVRTAALALQEKEKEKEKPNPSKPVYSAEEKVDFQNRFQKAIQKINNRIRSWGGEDF